MVIKRRLLFWLLKAYVKKWWKQSFLFFLAGLFVFFLLLMTVQWLLPKIPLGKSTTIGIVGFYTLDNLPTIVLFDLSQGLTQITADGKIVPGVAKSWDIRDSGKTYRFILKKDVYFTDKNNLISDKIQYPFSDIAVERPDKYAIVFRLKDAYSPFLITVSKPIFKKGYIGVGQYRIKNVDLNGNFVQTVSLASANNQYETKTYRFYPSEEALKIAYVLGDVSTAYSLSNGEFKNRSFQDFKNSRVSIRVNYTQLVTLFFNTKDNLLSDKKVRNALSYALSNTFSSGERAYSMYPSFSSFYTDIYNKAQDIDKAKTLLSENDASKQTKYSLHIKTLTKYKDTSEEIKKSLNLIGVDSIIEVVETIPAQFQAFLGDFRVPKDPDQYSIWHSNQENNITNYKNLRIDKYLEDGRKTVDIEARKSIYLDFQKYLMDDAPAAFLYFPYEYDIIRN